jgi:hypothetical protein
VCVTRSLAASWRGHREAPLEDDVGRADHLPSPAPVGCVRVESTLYRVPSPCRHLQESRRGASKPVRGGVPNLGATSGASRVDRRWHPGGVAGVTRHPQSSLAPRGA